MNLTLSKSRNPQSPKESFRELTLAALLTTSLIGLSACSVRATAGSGMRPRTIGMGDAAMAVGRGVQSQDRNGSVTARSPQEASERSAYSVDLSAPTRTLATAGSTTRTSITVRNTGADIPSLSILFDAPAADWSVVSVLSDRSTHPEEVLAPKGRGWDFGPLPHGGVIHVTLTMDPRRSGHGSYRLSAYAVAEDEGDVMRSIDQHIGGSDRLVSVWVRPRSETFKI